MTTSASIRAAIVQLVSGLDLKRNLESVEHWISQASAEGADLIVLPENFALMESPQLQELGSQEGDSGGPVRQRLASLAREHQCYILAGSLPCARRPDGQPCQGRVRSMSLLLGPDGHECARYDKIHLFDVAVGDAQGQYRESDRFEAGDSLTVHPIGTQGLVLGLSVCFDLRFPQLYQALSQQGANLMAVPSAFTYTTGKAHWELLLRARAIENQCYVLAPNQGGQHSEKRRTWGHSMIVDPWGEVIAAAPPEGEGMAVAELYLADILSRRQQMPLRSPLAGQVG